MAMFERLRALTWAQIKMLARNKAAVVISLGFGLVSMVLFGLLMGSGGDEQFSLGVVDEESSMASKRLIAGLKASDALYVSEGARDAELKALKSGRRRAVIIVGRGFQTGLLGDGATIQVYYDQSSPVAVATTRAAITSMVAGLNRSLQPGTRDLVKIEESTVQAQRLRVIDFLTPGVIGMVLMFANLFVGMRLIEWRQKGVLRRLGVTGLRPVELLLSQTVAHLGFSLGQAAILLAVALFGFNVVVQGDFVMLTVILVLGSICMLAVGYLLGSFPRNADSAAGVTMLVSFPMMLLSGSFFPIDRAPQFIQPLIQALPLTYLNHALRAVMNYGEVSGTF